MKVNRRQEISFTTNAKERKEAMNNESVVPLKGDQVLFENARWR
jgi:hypothetical protein